MPAYEKPMTADMLGFHTTGALHDSSPFGPYSAQPHYAPHLLYPPTLTSSVQDADFQYAAGTEFAPPQGFHSHRPSVVDPRLQQAPEITSYSQSGSQGTTFCICFQTLHDYNALPNLLFGVSFGTNRVNAVLELDGDLSGPLRQYVVSGEVPPFGSTGCYQFSVPLQLVMESTDPASRPQAVEVGTFTYNSSTAHIGPPSLSRKRKASNGSDYELQPAKRIVNAHVNVHEHSVEAADYDQTSPYSPYIPTPTASGMYHSQTRTASPRLGHNYSTSSASQVSMTAPSPHTPAFSPSFTTVKSEQSPHPPMTPVPRPASASSSLKPSVPKLVRTSTISTTPPGMSSAPGAPMHTQSFNPYALQALKATLKLNGDLDALAKGWSEEEYDARRRLVEFTRSQSGSTITANFKTVAPEDRSQNQITISCIWWKEKKECFVTSVDTIYLLEALVGVRFTVEEKNRIRRNLEGFRPLTVSKAKLDSEDFFKVIMGFPHPKPRNIEKDVKVFPWKILSHALKKIISKYSASYSSTASAILTPATSGYASTDASADYLLGSPHADLVSATMVRYPMATAPNYPHGMMQGRMSAPVTTAPMQDLRLQMPMGTLYNIPPYHGYQTMPQSTMAMTQPMSAPPAAMSQYEYATFVNESPASMAPLSSSTTSYARGSIDTADFITPANYSTGK